MTSAAATPPPRPSPPSPLGPRGTHEPRPRLWPAFVILVLLACALAISITPQIGNFERFVVMMLAPGAAALLGLAWLLLFSRLRWPERLLLPVAVVGLGAGAALLGHESMWTALWAYGLPLALLLAAVGLLVARRAAPRVRTGTTLALVACGWAAFTLGRLDGLDGQYLPQFRWRWTPSPETLLVRAERGPSAPAAFAGAATTLTLTPAPGDWPGFRGGARDGRVVTGRLDADWENTPPRERWRIRIGPGWSSFAHVAGRLFTQEQRGDDETVVCYDAETGREIWRHRDGSRFTEVVSGAGPRATPTFSNGRLSVMGAKAVLTCLEASTGAVIWQRDLMAEIDATLPMWGFSGSPLVTHGHAIVHADGSADRGLVAYDAATGAPAWSVAAPGMNYASAQLVTLAGTELVLFTDQQGVLALDPATGAERWRHTPDGWRGAPMVQVRPLDAAGVLVALGDGAGLARIDVARDGDDWSVTTRWSSRRLRPSFNDCVHHEGAIYGFDQSNFTCIDAETGARLWRGGRYGFGQVLLMAESSALLVLSETGDLVLVAADPQTRRELGRIRVLDGKTWNHPIVVGDRLFVRNGAEAACYELPMIAADPGD